MECGAVESEQEYCHEQGRTGIIFPFDRTTDSMYQTDRITFRTAVYVTRTYGGVAGKIREDLPMPIHQHR